MGEEIVRKFGMDMYTLLYLKWKPTRTYRIAQGTVLNETAWMGEEFGREWIHVYVWISAFAVYLKLS